MVRVVVEDGHVVLSLRRGKLELCIGVEGLALHEAESLVGKAIAYSLNAYGVPIRVLDGGRRA